MDKYLIRVAETGTFASTSLVLVEASTLDEAEEKAIQLAKDGEIEFSDGRYMDDQFYMTVDGYQVPRRVKK